VVGRLVLTTVGITVFNDDNTLFNKCGTETMSKMALKFVNKNVWSPLNNLQTKL